MNDFYSGFEIVIYIQVGVGDFNFIEFFSMGQGKMSQFFCGISM